MIACAITMTGAHAVFHWLATVMVGGGVLSAGHGMVVEYNIYRRDIPQEFRRLDDLWARTWPTMLHQGLAGMLMTPIAPVLLTHKFLSTTVSPCPSMQTGKNAMKSLFK